MDKTEVARKRKYEKQMHQEALAKAEKVKQDAQQLLNMGWGLITCKEPDGRTFVHALTPETLDVIFDDCGNSLAPLGVSEYPPQK